MPNPDTAAQVALLREMAAEELETIAEVNENESGYKQGCPAHVRLMELKERAGLANAALSAAADALEREAWCEENEADVCYTVKGEWMCSVFSASGNECKRHYAPTRDAAIDAARGGANDPR